MTTTIPKLNIREFRDEDYHDFASLHNAVFTEFTQTVDALRFEDQTRPEKCKHMRWVAERDGRIVGFASYDQHAFIYHPRKFEVDIAVHPEFLTRGIGSKLYDTVFDALRPLDPMSVTMWTRDDMQCRLRFLRNRGFEEKWRMWASELDLTTFDPTPFEHYLRSVLDDGVEIKSLAELSDDPDLDRKNFDLQLAVRDDVPLPPGETRQPVTFEQFMERDGHPTKVREGYFLAIADGQFVGVSNLWQSPEPDLIRTGLTAVRREYRRRGIAFALKLTALNWAKAQGYRRTVTDNASNNGPMLSINEQLGFAKKPAWVLFWADLSPAGR